MIALNFNFSNLSNSIISLCFFSFKNNIELIAPTTVKTTEHYMENGRKSKDSQMVGDYGVEEWRDGGKCFKFLSMNETREKNMQKCSTL